MEAEYSVAKGLLEAMLDVKHYLERLEALYGIDTRDELEWVDDVICWAVEDDEE